MLGNDVIDLGDPETRATHARFDARVFTSAERAALAGAADPVRLRWRLWAAKEAAWKCLVKLAPGTAFAPARFAVHTEGSRRGSVQVAGRRLRVAWFEEGDAIHAIASDGADPEAVVLRGLAWLPSAPEPELASAAARTLLGRVASDSLGCAADELAVGRAGRAPRLLRRGLPLGLDCSLAHHGRLLAAAVEPVTKPGTA